MMPFLLTGPPSTERETEQEVSELKQQVVKLRDRLQDERMFSTVRKQSQ